MVTRKSKGLSSLTNADRRKICEMYLNQRKKNEISEIFCVHKSTITRIVQRFIETDSHKSMPKGGRRSHSKLKDEQLEAVKEFYRSKENPTLKEIRTFCQSSLNVTLSIGTTFNVMKRIKQRIQEESDPPDEGKEGKREKPKDLDTATELDE